MVAMADDHEHDHEHTEPHDLGLQHDLGTLNRRGLGRRGLLGVLGGLGVVTLAGCAADDGGAADAAPTGRPSGAPPAGGPPSGSPPSGGPGGAPPSGGPGGQPPGGGRDLDQSGLDDGDIPEETQGPYPADGSNGIKVLTESGIVRSDLTSSFGSASGVAEGVPLSIALKVYDNGADGMSPYAGAAVYLWQCDREGRYSMYSQGAQDENYLRGVQEVAADGTLAFTSIFPACYQGRWPHLHFEVYPSLADATSASNKLRTSQIAFPAEVCQEVYDTAEGYEASQATFAQVSLDTDGIFSDGYSLQMGRLTGSVADGYSLRLNVPV